MEHANRKITYFKNLNGLRFFAAYFVLISHTELIKSRYELPLLKDSFPYLFPDSGLAVMFFFVLSGYLITYLLLKEFSKYNRISILRFYIRRILRIWPLYLFVCILGFFLLPYLFFDYPDKLLIRENYLTKLILYFFMLPNLAQVMGNSVAGLAPLWSIGVEEQFYLIWPILFAKCHRKMFLVLILIAIIIVIVPKVIFFLFSTDGIFDSLVLETTYKFLIKFRISCMAFGGIAAYLLYNNHPILKFMAKKSISNTLFLFLVIAGIFHWPLPADLYSLLFAAFILDVSTNPNHILNLERRTLNYLGSISFGIYMYHWIIIIVVLSTLKEYYNASYFNLVLYVLVSTLTILVSALSYKVLESPFLKLKTKFS